MHHEITDRAEFTGEPLLALERACHAAYDRIAAAADIAEAARRAPATEIGQADAIDVEGTAIRDWDEAVNAVIATRAAGLAGVAAKLRQVRKFVAVGLDEVAEAVALSAIEDVERLATTRS